MPQRRVTRFVGSSTPRRRCVVHYRVGQRVVVRRALLRLRSSWQRRHCRLPPSQPFDSDPSQSVPKRERDRQCFVASDRSLLATRTIVNAPQTRLSLVPSVALPAGRRVRDLNPTRIPLSTSPGREGSFFSSNEPWTMPPKQHSRRRRCAKLDARRSTCMVS